MVQASSDQSFRLRELVEPVVYRWMRFGLPSGLTFFLALALYLGVGFHPLFPVFVLSFMWLIYQAIAMNLQTAHRIRMSENGIHVRTLLREVLISWEGIHSVESVDRHDQAQPRRLALVKAAGGRQFLVFDSLLDFDVLFEEISRRNPAVTNRTMPLWKRLLLLQWGV